MKASEMTNEQIADTIERAYCASSSKFGLTMREAAARLRKLLCFKSTDGDLVGCLMPVYCIINEVPRTDYNMLVYPF